MADHSSQIKEYDMLRRNLIFATLTLLFVTLACRAATDIFSPEDEEYYNEEVEPIPTIASVKGQTCRVDFTDIMDAATSGEGSDADPLDDTYLVTYSVHGDSISNPSYESVSSDLQDEQDDTASQESVWDYFTSMIPADERTFITEFSITTDGKDNTLAAVTQTQSDPNDWALEIDILDINDTYNLTFTLIHEFGHLLTLNAEQVPPSIKVFNNPENEDILESEINACPQYFPGEGCSKANSYINAWYNRFWVDIYDEWDEINYIDDDDAYYEALDNFYYQYEDQFLTDYAVTTPEEDIADSWAFFVLSPKPDGDTIAEEKILFFYEYPELVQLRETILNNICVSFPQ
jgi:hypothetical protein